MDRRGVTPITTLRDRRDIDDGLRFLRRVVIQADEGVLTPAEALSFVFAETTRLLGDGPPEAA